MPAVFRPSGSVDDGFDKLQPFRDLRIGKLSLYEHPVVGLDVFHLEVREPHPGDGSVSMLNV